MFLDGAGGTGLTKLNNLGCYWKGLGDKGTTKINFRLNTTMDLSYKRATMLFENRRKSSKSC